LPETTTRVPLLEARAVTVRFGGLTAVDAVDARFDAGELVGIIGPNGAGKTTFFNAISGVTAPTAPARTVMRATASHAPSRRRGCSPTCRCGTTLPSA
jgi:branched-chain amino acid transport system ATP-binding protein